jgi:hypothetical protein
MIYGLRSRIPNRAQARDLGLPIAYRNAGGAPALVRAANEDGGGTADDNKLYGVPCRMGYPYEIGWGDMEVVFPGAFTEAIPQFMAKGTILRDHTWRELPIAYPTLMEERVQDGKSILYAEATYHVHPAAQAARTVAMDRTTNGLMVGLSIGFFLEDDGAMWFKDGPALLAFAKSNGYDLGLFDQKKINSTDSWILGVTKIRNLAEYSQCSVLQANDEAYATEARAGENPTDDVERQRSDDAEAKRLRDEAEATKLRDARLREITLKATMALAP